jgi:hypothetical protein
MRRLLNQSIRWHRRVLEVIDRAQRGRQEPGRQRNSLLHTLEVTTADHIQFGTDWSRAPSPLWSETLTPVFGAPVGSRILRPDDRGSSPFAQRRGQFDVSVLRARTMT